MLDLLLAVGRAETEMICCFCLAVAVAVNAHKMFTIYSCF